MMGKRKLILAKGETEPDGGPTMAAEYELREFAKLQRQRRIGAAVEFRREADGLRAAGYEMAARWLEARAAELEAESE